MALDQDEVKSALKAAIKEWLDEQITAFGWWAARTIGAAALAALLVVILTLKGWKIGG